MSTGKDIGERARRRREALGLTQGYISTVGELDRSWVSALERGGIADPGVEKIARLARVLRVSVDYLVFGVGADDAADRADQTWFETLSREARSFVRRIGESAVAALNDAQERTGRKAAEIADREAGGRPPPDGAPQ